MPGRQAHGRSLTTAPSKAKKNSGKASRARAQKNALNAFGIAQDNFAKRDKLTPRARQLDAEIEERGGKGGDDEDDDDEFDEDEDEDPRHKKAKAPRKPMNADVERGSDSEGNEWQLGGLAEDDEDSEIESDDAFGDSDEDKFQGYSFKGSKKRAPDSDDSDDSNDDEGETLGAEAIDLATALDQYVSESEEEGPDDGESEEEDEDSEGSEEEEEDSDQDSDDDGEADPDKLAALQGLVSGFDTSNPDEEVKPSSRQKISLGDLGLRTVDDPHMRNALKLMKKEDRESRPGATKKLDVPLSRREQGRMDRSAAYDKTNETLDRWTDTVKNNRRAEHLVFPLPQNSDTYNMTTEIKPLQAKDSANELESTIMGIMEQSGLSLEPERKPKPQEYDAEGNLLTRKEAINLKRKEREENAREAKRQKRINKIKSKAYHRVHRKERLRNEAAAAEDEDGEGLNSEEEREAQDRRRALERVGQRHKESKWAKLGNKNKRAVWDEDFRAGLSEMARKDEELRRRKSGRSGLDGDDSDSSSDGGSDEDDAARLRRELDELEAEDDDDRPRSALDGLKFMRNAEARKKAEEQKLLKDIRRTIDGEEEPEEEITEVGRRTYGAPGGKTFTTALDTSKRRAKNQDDEEDDEPVEIITSNGAAASGGWGRKAAEAEPESTEAGGWTRPDLRRKRKHDEGKVSNALDPSAPLVAAPKTKKSSSKPSSSNKTLTALNTSADTSSEDESDSDNDTTPYTSKRTKSSNSNSDLLARAFAGGDDPEANFAAEKAAIVADEGDKVIDNTLPGWGSWVGDGVSAREQKRHTGRFLTKVEGVKKEKRKDAKLDKVIINEKRVKKNDKYRATQLPHPFESREQYERSLRLPVGPEWQTKHTYQDAVKPRVLVKQGIITPMSKPVV